MSASKWAYDPVRCDGDICPGDCDRCQKNDRGNEEMEDYKKLIIALRNCVRTDCGDCFYLEHCLAGDRENGYMGSESVMHDAADAIEKLMEMQSRNGEEL